MRKSVLRVMTPVVVGGAIVATGAGIASAATPHEGNVLSATTTGTDQYPTLNTLRHSWDEGGAHVGYGLAKMVSAAWLGVPLSILDLPKEAMTPAIPVNH